MWRPPLRGRSPGLRECAVAYALVLIIMLLLFTMGVRFYRCTSMPRLGAGLPAGENPDTDIVVMLAPQLIPLTLG